MVDEPDEVDRTLDDLTTDELADLFGISALPRRMRAVNRAVVRTVKPFRGVLTDTGRSLLGSSGKRLRSVLTVAAADLGPTFDARVQNAAAAVELVQVGSLIHDDVIEDAPTRRGYPTINAIDGIGPAVVTGDLVLAAAARLVAGLGTEASAMLANGLEDMAAGQMLELRDAFDTTRTVENHMRAIQAKTGALFACACRLGGWCARLPRKQQDILTRYGTTFGVGYQLLDDVLDIAGDPQRLGKAVGADIGAGIYTLPVLLALQERGGRTLDRLLRRGRSDDLAEALQRVRRSGAVGQGLDAAEQWMRQARRAAGQLGRSRVAKGLQALPLAYASWAVDQLMEASAPPPPPAG